jgi:putative SOS response-associated peptidase YedK
MCGRFTLTAPYDVIYDYFGIGDQSPQPVFKPRYNIAPSQDIAVVMQLPDQSSRHLAMMHWGLIPHWARDKKMAYTMINAKAETLAEKPSYRTAYKKRRCLIPADGYYEWATARTQAVDNVGNKLSKPLQDHKQPYYIQYHHHDLFAFAGLWEHWQGDQEEIYSCTIITTDADKKIGKIHTRMPVIMAPACYDRWLDPENQDTASLQDCLMTDTSDIEFYPVSTVVNSPKNEGRDLIEKLTIER